MRIVEFERTALREFRRRIGARPVAPGSGEGVRFMVTEICWDIALELDPRALVLLALENEELMLMTPTATQVHGEDTPCAADVLRWRLYEHLEAVLAPFVRRGLKTAGIQGNLREQRTDRQAVAPELSKRQSPPSIESLSG